MILDDAWHRSCWDIAQNLVDQGEDPSKSSGRFNMYLNDGGAQNEHDFWIDDFSLTSAVPTLCATDADCAGGVCNLGMCAPCDSSCDGCSGAGPSGCDACKCGYADNGSGCEYSPCASNGDCDYGAGERCAIIDGGEFWDHDDFEQGVDGWTAANGANAPTQDCSTAFTGACSLAMESSDALNFGGSDYEAGQSSAGFSVREYPFVCFAYKVPASTTHVAVLLNGPSFDGYRTLGLHSGWDADASFHKLAGGGLWRADLEADGEWHHDCWNIEDGIDGLASGQATDEPPVVNEIRFQVASPAGELWIDDFVVSKSQSPLLYPTTCAKPACRCASSEVCAPTGECVAGCAADEVVAFFDDTTPVCVPGGPALHLFDITLTPHADEGDCTPGMVRVADIAAVTSGDDGEPTLHYELSYVGDSSGALEPSPLSVVAGEVVVSKAGVAEDGTLTVTAAAAPTCCSATSP